MGAGLTNMHGNNVWIDMGARILRYTYVYLDVPINAVHVILKLRKFIFGGRTLT